jgi:hypothetical protein
LLLVGAAEGRGWGQSAPILSVERGEGTEGCPDTEALTGRVEHIRGKPTDQVKSGYQVTFAHDENGFSATIRTSHDAGGVRTLEDRGSTCAALAQATAVTLALLLDSDTTPSEPPPKPPPAPAPAPVSVPAPAPAPSPVTTLERPSPRITVTLGGAAWLGVVKDLSSTLAGQAGITSAQWHISLGVFGTLPQDIALGPGTVHESLFGGVATICYAPLKLDPWSLDVCSGGYIGRLNAEGRGYSTNTEQGRSWVAIPFEAGVTYGSGPFGAELTGGALLPVERQNFKIDNLGVAYESKAVAGILTLRLIARFKL